MYILRIKLPGINIVLAGEGFAESRFYLLFPLINTNGPSNPAKFILKVPIHKSSIVKSLVSGL